MTLATVSKINFDTIQAIGIFGYIKNQVSGEAFYVLISRSMEARGDTRGGGGAGTFTHNVTCQ